MYQTIEAAYVNASKYLHNILLNCMDCTVNKYCTACWTLQYNRKHQMLLTFRKLSDHVLQNVCCTLLYIVK
jgi:hypothetical protein